MLFQAPKAQHKQCVSIVGVGVKTPSGCGWQTHIHKIPSSTPKRSSNRIPITANGTLTFTKIVCCVGRSFGIKTFSNPPQNNQSNNLQRETHPRKPLFRKGYFAEKYTHFIKSSNCSKNRTKFLMTNATPITSMNTCPVNRCYELMMSVRFATPKLPSICINLYKTFCGT